MDCSELELEDYGQEDDFSVEDALRILSLNSHRNTTRWASVSKELFVNGRPTEDQMYVEPQYEKPDPEFEEHYRMLVFEAIAIAKAYVMAGIEAELQETRASLGQ